MFIDSQPGAARAGIEAGQGAHRPLDDGRRLAAAGVEFLAVGAHHHRSITSDAKIQSQEAHRRILSPLLAAIIVGNDVGRAIRCGSENFAIFVASRPADMYIPTTSINHLTRECAP
jgi:hypothetical protein